MIVENAELSLLFADSLIKSKDKIDRVKGNLAVKIRTEFENFTKTLTKFDPNLLDEIKGISKEHGEFDLLALRIPHVEGGLMEDWIIFPDGEMYTARVTQSNPDVVDLDTFEIPTDDQLINGRNELLSNLSIRFGSLMV